MIFSILLFSLIFALNADRISNQAKNTILPPTKASEKLETTFTPNKQPLAQQKPQLLNKQLQQSVMPISNNPIVGYSLCPYTHPYYDNQKCYKCYPNQVFDSTNGKCNQKVTKSEPIDPESIQSRLKSMMEAVAPCPTLKYIHYNSLDNRCYKCFPRWRYNPVDGNCLYTQKEKLEQQQQLKKQNKNNNKKIQYQGETTDPITTNPIVGYSMCPYTHPYYNNQNQRCYKCYPNQSYNPKDQSCIKLNNDGNNNGNQSQNNDKKKKKLEKIDLITLPRQQIEKLLRQQQQEQIEK